MTSSLVGSEMCIRDRKLAVLACRSSAVMPSRRLARRYTSGLDPKVQERSCLLYTSDAADDM
eukprot:9686421-Prorocentrum_lima.AAC.1